MRHLIFAAAFAVAASLGNAAAPDVPDTMLAAAMDRGGGPEVLSIHHLPVPKLKAGEVLIAVRTAGIGAWEAGMREHPGERARFPIILGSDGAGTIAELGPGVSGLEVGDEVYGSGGAFNAEYVAVPAENVARIPKGVDMTQAGALAISGLSALQGIDDALQLKKGETLIIHGATGGVGTLAIQFAKLRGAKVFATASSEEGMALARKLGADVVVNGRTVDLNGAIQQFAPHGVDAVFGLAGGDALERCIDGLRHDGRGRVAYLYGMEPLPRPRFAVRMVLYSFVSGRDELRRLDTAVLASKAQVPIAATYPLAQAAEAHRRLEGGHLLGKIVLQVR
jgi:NADPH2:quinone reductase